MAKFTVLSPIRHNGEDYSVGDTIEVKKKEQIAALIAAGVVADPAEPAEQAQPADPAAPVEQAQPADGGIDGGQAA